MVLLSRSLATSAPEPEATANMLLLAEHETTGPLPVGFEFEHFGARYDQFELSTDGFIGFGNRSYPGGGDARLRLEVACRPRLGEGRVAYELRGSAPRRRLVVSFTDPRRLYTALHMTVHERTGMIEVRGGGPSLGDPTIRQLDMVHPSPSRANSARKIG